MKTFPLRADPPQHLRACCCGSSPPTAQYFKIIASAPPPRISPLAILYLITHPQTQFSLSEDDLLGTAPPRPRSCQAQVPQPLSAHDLTYY